MTGVTARASSLLAIAVCLGLLFSSLGVLVSLPRDVPVTSSLHTTAGGTSPSDPLTLVPPLSTTLTSPSAIKKGDFGFSVAINGTTVVIGAPSETALGYRSAGNVYIFDEATGALVATLTSPNIQIAGLFGWSVAIDGSLVVVGAPGETVSGHASAGNAYVFDSPSGTLVTTLTNPIAQTDGFFGSSVAIDGTTVVVGAETQTVSGYHGAGRAYVFDATTGALVTKLKSPTTQSAGLFGASVAINGTRVLVGAPQELDSTTVEAGHAYEFKSSGALVTTLTSPSAQSYGLFGSSVAISAKEIVVGAPGEYASSQSGAGNTYTFKLSGTSISTLTSANPRLGGAFGTSVSLYGQIIVVGAPGETAGGYGGAGHVYVYEKGSYVSTLGSRNPQGNGSFGQSVATNGTSVVVGAPYETASGLSMAGHVYLLPAVADPLDFGDAIAVSGDLVVVGAPSENFDGYAYAGNAYVFNWTTGSLVTTLNNPGPQSDAEFGASVAIWGNTVVVGTFYYTVSGDQYAGRAYVFNATTGALTWTLDSPKVQKLGHFGWSVAVNGTTAVIGAPFEKASGVSSAGNAYSFSTTTGALISKLTNPSPVSYGEFGYSVAAGSTTAVVGAPGQNLVYVYDSSTGKLVSTLSDACSCGSLGWSVALSGTTVVAGAPDETYSGLGSAGEAYVFATSGGPASATLVIGTPQSSGVFGTSVAIIGIDVLIGAPGETSSSLTSAGNAYEFSSSGGSPIATYASSDPQSYGSFGESVGIASGVEVVGAPYESGAVGFGEGNVYVF